MGNPSFRDNVFEQECAAILDHIMTLEFIWKISDLSSLESDENIEAMMDRMSLKTPIKSRPGDESFDEDSLSGGDSGDGMWKSLELFELLQKGVVLCGLMNVLKPGAIQKVNKQTDREFLCKENVWRFVAACKNQLNLPFEDLFSVSDCYSDDITRQRKVLRTLSIVLKKAEEIIASEQKKRDELEEEKPKEVLKQEQKKNVLKELLETEHNYVKDLVIMRDDIMRLEKAGALTKEQIASVFGNVKDILKFQSTFLRELEDCSPEHTGQLFVTWAKEFAVYGPYCLNHESSGAAIASLMPVLVKANMKLEPKFELGSYLLKPVQRICKYPLLLKELSKCTDESTKEHEEIVKGLEAMKAVTSFINELKKRREAQELVRQLEAKIENWDEKGDMRVYGVLKYDSMLGLLKDNGKLIDYHCFVFEKLFIYCKEEFEKKEAVYTLKGKVLLSNAGTTFEALSEKVPGGPGFRLKSSTGESYIFRTKNKEQHARWVAAMKACVASAQRPDKNF